MAVFDLDGGVSVVDHLRDISGERYFDGLQDQRDVTGPCTLGHNGAWATILLTVQNRVKKTVDQWRPTSYIFQRWRRLRGAWRRQDQFRIKAHEIDALVAEMARRRSEPLGVAALPGQAELDVVLPAGDLDGDLPEV